MDHQPKKLGFYRLTAEFSLSGYLPAGLYVSNAQVVLTLGLGVGRSEISGRGPGYVASPRRVLQTLQAAT